MFYLSESIHKNLSYTLVLTLFELNVFLIKLEN